jgi:hypothetical protein
MNTARRVSGETLEFGGARRTAGDESAGAQLYLTRSQVQRRFCTMTAMERPSLASSIVWKGSRFPSTRPPAAAASAEATRV